MSFKNQKRPLYDVLGVAPTASEVEIARAYRKLALQYHPDRNPDGVETFKELSNAYAILSDKEKRGMYDVTGIVPGSAEDPNGAGGADGDARSMQERSEDIRKEIAIFFETYRGSEEERADFVKSFTKCDGNFRKMVREYLVFDNGIETEVKRLHRLGDALMQAGHLQPTALWNKSTTPQAIAKAERDMRKEREEADQVLREMGLDEESVRKAKEASENADLGALQALIQQRQQHSWQSMMSNLEAKYVDEEKENRRAAKFRQAKKAKKASSSASTPVTGTTTSRKQHRRVERTDDE